ncbi:MAG: hypothetical protein HY290_18785 [Planctomycetia bacterium]|nr:hypothetical protein [Planctomycetia bacterium]
MVGLRVVVGLRAVATCRALGICLAVECPAACREWAAPAVRAALAALVQIVR